MNYAQLHLLVNHIPVVALPLVTVFLIFSVFFKNVEMKNLKVGDKIKIYFRTFGAMSIETRTIVGIDKNTITTDEELWPNDSNERENEIFSRLTGKCLNDNTAFGVSRSIDPL